MKKLLLFIAGISILFLQVVPMEIRVMAMRTWETVSLQILHWVMS